MQNVSFCNAPFFVEKARLRPVIDADSIARGDRLGNVPAVCDEPLFGRILVAGGQFAYNPDHPLAQKKNASIMDCREYTMLTGLEHSVEDRLLRKTYGEQNITWKRVIRSDSIDTVMKMVKSGSGIAIGPQSFAEYYGVTAVPLVPARQDSLYFACLKSKKKEPEIREFQRYLTTLVSSVYPD